MPCQWKGEYFAVCEAREITTSREKEVRGVTFVTPILATQGELAHLYGLVSPCFIAHKAVNVK